MSLPFSNHSLLTSIVLNEKRIKNDQKQAKKDEISSHWRKGGWCVMCREEREKKMEQKSPNANESILRERKKKRQK